ncbi:hypothetical protein [Sphingomonas sp.]|uniref:hypothetical protein n=1 Tax=Sphingomonas sp. TaxID=28214 RepID=UPI002CB1B556|nr:hypothetical protein [Sphingomonas sp.]HWK35755.1 hypothetical protein [Sphingomonas sp.]
MSVSFRPIGTALAAGIAAALCITAAAAPAMAADGQAATAKAEKDNKICITARDGQAASTGTVLKRQVCKTRDQWAAQGVKFSSRTASEGGQVAAR